MAAFTRKDPADRTAFAAHWNRIRGDRTIMMKTILFDGQVAGSVLSFDLFGEPNVSYWIGREFWSKGIATDALAKFLQLNTTRPLDARVAEDNIASIRVLEKCGLAMTGVDKGFANARGAEIAKLIFELKAKDHNRLIPQEGRRPGATYGGGTMIRGIHGLFYSSEPEATRAFIRDKLRLPYTDVGEGWLIFDLPEGDVGVHSIDEGGEAEAGMHDVSFYCDDIKATVSELRARGVHFTSEIADHGYGFVTYFTMPGGVQVQLYEPKYRKGTGRPKPRHPRGTRVPAKLKKSKTPAKRRRRR